MEEICEYSKLISLYTHIISIYLYLKRKLCYKEPSCIGICKQGFILLNFSQFSMCGLVGFQLTWAEHAWAQLQTTDSGQTFLYLYSLNSGLPDMCPSQSRD